MFQVNQISVRYQTDQMAVKEVTFSIQEPAIVGIIGPNGAGKSTLIKAMLDLIPHTGEIFFDSLPLKQFQKKIAYVEQKSAIDETFPITVKECVSLGLYPQMHFYQRIKKADWQKVEEALKAVAMLEFKNRQIGELSGGQFQRVLIARTLVQNADLIFLDEPFVGIDIVSEEIIMNLLQDLKSQGKYIFIVHHDLSKVETYFDQLILMKQQLIAVGPTKQVFTPKKLGQAFGQSLVVLGGE